ncbi:carbohydrate ABC transporter permease [Cohnella sp. GCM10027633]|uniref:carbohydrate ABC transporter permease n=1 Tax=unclassified Cohnella TaxID=2636738 RepID=UPI003632CDAD
MVARMSSGRKLFVGLNYLFLITLSLLCILPLLNVFMISLSSKPAVTAGLVSFWPVGFTLDSYSFVLHKPEFFHAFGVSIERVLLGVSLNMLLTVLIAYPLSKETDKFMGRTKYVWFFVFTMLFSGGLIPSYLIVNKLHLTDSIWALVLPGAVPIFNVILLLNFFRSLPKELEEAAFIDGAGHWRVLWRIFVPLSKPSLATITLFVIVGHWNSWFDGLIYMNNSDGYPLSSYLQTVVVKLDASIMQSVDVEKLANISNETNKAAQIFLASLPVLLVYPFLQRFFISGIVMGSVKE